MDENIYKEESEIPSQKENPDIDASNGIVEAEMVFINPTISTEEEDKLILQSVKKFGTKCVQIAKLFKNRSDVSVRNRYRILIKNEGIEKITTNPTNDNEQQSPSSKFPNLFMLDHTVIFDIADLRKFTSNDIFCGQLIFPYQKQ